MTKKELKWRLKELPNADEIASLVAEEVISKEEARKLLFSEDVNDSEKLKAKEEEIKFLRELVDKLASRHNGWTTIYHEYERITPRYPRWYQTYGPLMQTFSTSGNLGTITSTTGAVGHVSNLTNIMSASQQSMKGLSSLN